MKAGSVIGGGDELEMVMLSKFISILNIISHHLHDMSSTKRHIPAGGHQTFYVMKAGSYNANCPGNINCMHRI